MKRYLMLFALSLFLLSGCVSKTNNTQENKDKEEVKIEDKKENNVSKNEDYICKRASKLHTEVCTRTHSNYFCSGSGYKNQTIIYGSLGQNDILTSGDAFDCDVNGDGVYDPLEERFYYVTDLESDSDYAVLIYYTNTTNGLADNTSNSLVSYDENNKNINGPLTAIKNLPTKEQWNNVSLSNEKRKITTVEGLDKNENGSLSTINYSNYAARFLTSLELNKACNIKVGTQTDGELDNCNYLMENTKYSNDSFAAFGYWLETPYKSLNYVWNVSGQYRKNALYSAGDNSIVGTRPVIEVLKRDIEFENIGVGK